jgi:hypothetical protein
MLCAHRRFPTLLHAANPIPNADNNRQQFNFSNVNETPFVPLKNAKPPNSPSHLHDAPDESTSFCHQNKNPRQN